MDALLFVFFFNLFVWCFSAHIYYIKLKCAVYHPVSIYLIYHMIGFVLRPLSIYLNDGSDLWFRIGIIPSEYDIIFSGIISSIALVSFTILPLFIKGEFHKFEMIKPFSIGVQFTNRFYFLIFFFILLGLYGTYKAYGGAGLSSVYSYEVDILERVGGQRLNGVSGYTTALAEFIPVSLLLLMLVKGPGNYLFLVLLALFVLLRMWIGSQRLSFVVVLLVTMVYTLILARKRFPPIKVILMAFAFLLIFDFIGSDRLAFRKILDGEPLTGFVEHYQLERSSNLLLNDFKEFDVTTAIYKIVPVETGYNYGTQYARLLVWPIPRQIWPEKPIFTDRINLNDYGNFWALTWSSHGDYYSNFGVPSLVMLMVLVSILLQVLYKNAASLKKVSSILSFLVVLMYMKTIFRDGGVTVFYFLGFSFIPVMAFLFLCRPNIKLLYKR